MLILFNIQRILTGVHISNTIEYAYSLLADIDRIVNKDRPSTDQLLSGVLNSIAGLFIQFLNVV